MDNKNLLFINDEAVDVPSSTQHLQTKVYKKRWLMLFLFCCCTFANGCLFTTTSAINKSMCYYYDVSPKATDWLANSFNVITFFIAMPSSYFISRFGKRVSLILAASLNAVCGCLHFAGLNEHGFLFILFGQIAAALPVGIILQFAPGISAVWFSNNEQSKATSIGVFSNFIGVATGYVQSDNMVSDTSDKSVLRNNLFYLFLSQLSFLIVNLVLICALFKEAPKLPPSYSAQFKQIKSVEDHLTFTQSIKLLVSDKHFNIMIHTFGVMFSLMTVLITALDELMSNIPQNYVGWLGFQLNICGVVGMCTVGIINDRFKKYRFISIVLSFGALCSWILFTFFTIHMSSTAILFVNIGLIGSFTAGHVSHAIDSAVEMTYPVAETLTTSFLITAASLYGFVFVLFIVAFIDDGRKTLACYIIMGLYTVVFILSCSTHIKTKRNDAEDNCKPINEPDVGRV